MLWASLLATHSALLTNGGFESGLDGWRPFWSRASGAGSAHLDTAVFHSGHASVRIEHHGEQDWSFEPNLRLPVQPGDFFEYAGWFKVQGAGNVNLCVSTWDRNGKVLEWSFGERTVQERPDWQFVSTRFVVPAQVAFVQPRIIGYGPITNFPRLRGVHPDWTTAAWPKDIIVGADGHWIKGWGVEARDGGMVSCGVICDRCALDYARQRIPADLASHPYRCRFIDTTTAAPWHECYNEAHPMTRTESRQWKMELLRYVSDECRLVTGCETGHDASVPFLDYFEGMMSLGPYRVPDSGRRMSQIWTNVPERVAKFQLGQAYRLPLWELVYHDCTVAQWYWGDYNNKLPALWDKRDLFNLLYGVPPMFMFDSRLWEQNKDRFVRSYRNTCPYVRQVGYAEMTDHRFLTSDRNVQQSKFANGVTITVNFGDTSYQLSDKVTLSPLGFEVSAKQ